MNVTHKVHSVRSPIIHFGSQYMWAIWREIIPKDSKVVVNFFHGKPEDGPEVSKHIEGGGGGQTFFATSGGKRKEGLAAAIQEIKSLF